MSQKVKMCELCGKEPAAVPDRERMGRPINRICSRCHGQRLRGDLSRIVRQVAPDAPRAGGEP